MVISIWWGFFESSQLALHYLKLTMTRYTNPSVHEKPSFFLEVSCLIVYKYHFTHVIQTRNWTQDLSMSSIKCLPFVMANRKTIIILVVIVIIVATKHQSMNHVWRIADEWWPNWAINVTSPMERAMLCLECYHCRTLFWQIGMFGTRVNGLSSLLFKGTAHTKCRLSMFTYSSLHRLITIHDSIQFSVHQPAHKCKKACEA